MWRFAIAVQCGKPVLCIYYLYSALSRYSVMQWIIHQYTVLIWFLRELLQNLMLPEIDNVFVPSINSRYFIICKSKYVLTALLFPSDFTIWYLYFSLIIFHFHIWFFGLLNISSSFESKTYRYKHDLLIFLLIRCMSMHDFKHCNHFIRRFKESIKVWQLGYISACIMDRGDLSELGNS